MSGFLAILDASGRCFPHDSALGLARALAWRGPDGSQVWHDETVALVCTRFLTAEEDKTSSGIVEFAGLTITGDVRLDDRRSLINRLAATACPVSPATCDLALVLHAYRQYGETCLDHLAGDFAFILWDSRRRRLFAARDQMGVVPLYWSEMGSVTVLGNSLHGVLAHRNIDDRFDDDMIADYLAVGIRLKADRTFYRCIRRLPAGHCLAAGRGGIAVRRYWSMPDSPTRPVRRRPEEYVEEFRALFADILRDRLRGAAAATHLSGGMDAASVAVSLARLMRPGAGSLTAYTHVVSELFPDSDGALAEVTARHAGISWEAVPIEPILAGEEAAIPLVGPAEPVLPPQLSFRGAIERRTATHARVLFNGYGGDPLFAEDADLPLRENPVTASLYGIRDIAFCATRDPGLVRLWLNRAPPPGDRGKHMIADEVLLNPEFSAKFRIQERRSDWFNQPPALPIASMATHPIWMARMTEADPDLTGLPLKQCFPFFDLRLLRFVASLPTRPWRTAKTMLRMAMGNLLPPQVRLRSKIGAGGDVLRAYLAAHGPPPWMYELLNADGVEAYIDKAATMQCLAGSAAQERISSRRLTFLFCVAHWLQKRPRRRI